MLISCNRLKKYIKNNEDIDWLHIWDIFTIRTAEVEEVTKKGNKFDGVVIAEIKECKKHPDSDHMHVLKVDCGEKELIEVVCGAINVRVGLKTAYIKVGGHIDGMEITARPLRGVISNGMCCSIRELGIGDDHDGIIELPDDAPIGLDLKEYLPIEDIIVEIDNKSLTNRPDLWGHYGIAREIAAISNHELLPLEIEEIKNKLKDLDVKINNCELCNRYCGIKVDNITNNKTPLDMQIFLYYVGMRSISLIVDLTNYLMLELGQPMHAFDSRVVKNIEVGLAKNGDTFTTLDGIERELTDQMLMIKNADEYFGIAGVMGGLDSEILTDTTSVIFESANFNAGSIRRTAVALGLRTEASARYEKSLDPNLTDLALKRLLFLLHQENKDMKIASNLTDVYPNPLKEITISLKKDLLATYMGVRLGSDTVNNILENLGFKVKVNEDDYEVTVPTYRHSKDINIAEDLIEEIARIYGLENIESQSLKLELCTKESDTVFNQEYEIKNLLSTKYNMHEVHSYMWYDTDTLKELNITKDGVKLLGKSENNILRDDLSLSLMNIVNNNFKNYSKFNIFELATIIDNNHNKRILSIIMTDEEKNIEIVYNKAKKIAKYIFKALKNINIELVNNVNEKEYYEQDYGKVIVIENNNIGQVNILKQKYANKLSKKKAIVCIDIDFDKYVELDKNTIIAKDISKFPVVNLDYTIILKQTQKFIDLKNALDSFRSNLINNLFLVTIYDNKYTVRYVLGSNYKTLEQKDLQTFKERFIDHIRANGFEIIE